MVENWGTYFGEKCNLKTGRRREQVGQDVVITGNKEGLGVLGQNRVIIQCHLC